jgi:antitoxin ParD1/3/4
MNVSLKPEVQRFVEEKVRTGQHASPDEAVNALRTQARDQEGQTAEDIESLRAEVDLGIAEADRGEFANFTAEDVIAERHAAMAARAKGA